MRIDTKHALAAALVAALAAPLAHAQDTPTFGDLEKIQANTVLLKAQVAQAQQRAALAKAGGDASAVSSGDATSSDVRPVVSEVYGAPGDLKATFLVTVGAGSESIVGRAGSVLPGGCMVSSIATDAVRLRCAGRVVNAGFAGQAVQRVPAQGSIGSPMGQSFQVMPPVPMPAPSPTTN